MNIPIIGRFLPKKKKEEKKVLPRSLEEYKDNLDVQIAKAKADLRTLENQTKTKVRVEINNILDSKKNKKENPRAVVRLKNSYYCLLLIREAKSRMNDIQHSYELNGILNTLSDVIKTVNGLEGKTDNVNTFLLRYREKKLKSNVAAARDGDMREFFSQSIDELIPDDVVEELVSKKKTLDDSLNEDDSVLQEADMLFGDAANSGGMDVNDMMKVTFDK